MSSVNRLLVLVFIVFRLLTKDFCAQLDTNKTLNWFKAASKVKDFTDNGKCPMDTAHWSLQIEDHSLMICKDFESSILSSRNLPNLLVFSVVNRFH